jgi:hypothetical protein
MHWFKSHEGISVQCVRWTQSYLFAGIAMAFMEESLSLFVLFVCRM